MTMRNKQAMSLIGWILIVLAEFTMMNHIFPHLELADLL